MAAEFHQKSGQKLYGEGKFRDALDAFNMALNYDDVNAISVLDNRVATYCKLGQLSLARADAKKMAKDFPEDARGYLRLGKVLVLSGSTDKALKVYNLGLQKLANKNPSRKLLEQLKNKLSDELPRLDPFTAMNIDVALEILKHLSFSQRVGIIRVSKTWEGIIVSHPELWRELDFTSAAKPLSPQIIAKYVKRSNGNLKGAIIKNTTPKTTTRVIALLDRCPKLETLNIGLEDVDAPFFKIATMNRGLKTLILSSMVSPKHEDLMVFLDKLPLLETIALLDIKALPSSRKYSQWIPHSDPKVFPNLKRIALRSPFAYNLIVPYILTDINTNAFPNLEELSLHFSSIHSNLAPTFPNVAISVPVIPNLDQFHLPPIRHLALVGHKLHQVFFHLLPKSLEVLKISGGVQPHMRQDTPAVGFCPKLRDLKLINLRSIDGSPRSPFSSFLDLSSGCLRTLHLEGCIQLPCDQFLKIVKSKPAIVERLTDLSIISSPTCDDNFCSALVIFKSLKYLDVSRSSITGCTLRLFADARVSDDESVPKLDKLVIEACENISSDAIDYARSKGLTVVVQSWTWQTMSTRLMNMRELNG
ncbi:hypothetical protein N7495_007268 [Penicillium taxi]|uniref:uncharacterized protein n=1 Tax=Penicillium taxi TaxID=168475 RepID=UPI0025458079|nr:uncharacterized protein N7495_007268 [Penicillium taxi]KAJ5895577.1 hypothetical protein N7495_007268 [Penicillium taxi]